MEDQQTIVVAAVIRESHLPCYVQLEATVIRVIGEAAVHVRISVYVGQNSWRTFRVPESARSRPVSVAAHEPKPPNGEEQHRQERDDRDDFIAVERHAGCVYWLFLGAGGSLGATGFVKNSSIALPTVQ